MEIKIADYAQNYQPQWTCEMPEGCPPEDVLIAHEHPFYRLAHDDKSYNDSDFASYAELNPGKDWGEMLPLAVGLSILNDEQKARNNMRLPIFKQYKGIIALNLNETDGVEKQTGVHKSHYTWWRTTSFCTTNLQMIQI